MVSGEPTITWKSIIKPGISVLKKIIWISIFAYFVLLFQIDLFDFMGRHIFYNFKK